MSRLRNKTAVITGGNSGIGFETARKFVDEGAKVVIFGRDQKTLDSAVQTLNGNAIAVRGDVTNTDDLDNLFTVSREKLGRIDILFVNAGIGKPRPFEEIDEVYFDQTVGVNIKGAFFTVQKALPHLKDGSSIIFTTSALDEKGMPGMSVYSATKAAVRSMTRTLAAELAPKGIRVNSIAPGAIETPIYERMGLPAEAMQEMARSIMSQVPVGRFGQPIEIAQPVVYLASDESSYMTGAELTVDGGFGQV